MDRSNLNVFVFSEFVLGDASKDLQEENPKVTKRIIHYLHQNLNSSLPKTSQLQDNYKISLCGSEALFPCLIK